MDTARNYEGRRILPYKAFAETDSRHLGWNRELQIVVDNNLADKLMGSMNSDYMTLGVCIQYVIDILNIGSLIQANEIPRHSF